ncbi:uncharacterized protein ARMOST_04131 [Armillaria ostoyae]|uniref:Uncharacterized protein n=1 Tax=Armillaria ostoyae TaxID=47428 RepID=A0A284QWG0_ARMOS|nr:uncharacterized protein ARMOST_04131 [Armillaria ostoyae]
MSFPMSNPDHSWNEWAWNQPTPQPRGGRPTTGIPQMSSRHGMRPQGQAMFQEPPLPPTQSRRPRTTGGTYGLGTEPPHPILSPFAPRTPNAPTLRMPRPRYRLSSSSRPFTIPAMPVLYGLAPPSSQPPNLNLSLPSLSTLPVPSESAPPPTASPTPTKKATPTPPNMEEMNQLLSEKTTTPSTPTGEITNGQNLTSSTEPSSAHTIPRPGSSNGSTSSSEAQHTPRIPESQWDSTSPSPTTSHFHDAEEMQPWRPAYSQIATDPNVQPPPGITYQMLAPEPRPNSTSWSTTYSHWPSQRETAPIWTGPPDFDNFNQDEDTFGGWANKDEETTGSYTTDVYRGNRGYTPAPYQPSFYTAPFPLPNSPNWEY